MFSFVWATANSFPLAASVVAVLLFIYIQGCIALAHQVQLESVKKG